MKRKMSLILILMFSLYVNAQFSQENSLFCKAIVLYERGSDGFYHRSTDKILPKVDNIVNYYAYDKKTHNLYVMTQNGNIIITLDKKHSKTIRQNRGIPKVKNTEIEELVAKKTQELDDKYRALNATWTKHLEDSIAKAKLDSIECQKRLAAQQASILKQQSEYRMRHDYHWVPTENISLHCTVCDESLTKDSVYCLGIKNDSIYYISPKKGDLGLYYIAYHVSKIPAALKTNSKFLYHYDVFRDSLTNDDMDIAENLPYYNYFSLEKHISEIKKRAPYGYFDSWSWNSEYSMVTFNFRYTNTNKSTIRYIDVYFKIKNDVGDVRCTGNFRGTGPLKEFESASWEWDRSRYFVSGDATNMSIAKVILTYMNGTKKVLTGRLLQFNEDD